MRTFERTASRTSVRTFDRTASGALPVISDPNFEYTTLLLPGNGTNGAQNNTFLDSSTNNFTITRNGNTTQGAFSPFSQTGWGNYFDGTGDYLTVASNAAFGYGTGDFTIECWFYLNALPGGVNGSYIIDQRTTATQVAIAAYIYSDATIVLYVNGGVAASGGTVVANQWNHFAICRSATTTKMFLNGTQIGSNYSDSNNYGTLPVAIASRYNGQDYVNGYISNFRIVKGTAVYTAAFTVPTAPLTAISGTSLLTCQSNRFVDNSSNAFAITLNGDVSVQAFSPFNPTAAWSAATYGGSGYFDGSGDYLQAASSSSLAFSGDFTVESWLYYTGTATGLTPAILYNSSTTGVSAFEINNGSTYLDFAGIAATDTVVRVTLTGASIGPNEWVHVAFVRSSGVIKAYVNGVAVATTLSNSATTGQIVQIGTGRSVGPGGSWVGYMSGYRAVSSAVYTSNFTPPTAPLTAITNTQLLCNFTNAGIYDATSKNDLETVGNAQISTAQSKFGGSSMYFDGTGDVLSIPDTQNLKFGTGDFTVEAWVYMTATPSAQYAQIIGRTEYGTNADWMLQITNSRTLTWYMQNSFVATSTGTVPLNTWTHVAVTRYGSSIRLFINGIVDGTATNSGSTEFNSSGAYTIGADQAGDEVMFTGYINDLRTTKGVARYTANFTPPTTAFPVL